MLSQTLWQAHHIVDQAVDDALASLGLSTSLVGTMAFIAQDPGLSAADLARLAKITPQSAAHAVNRLLELALITRSPHPVHGRVLRLHLTDRGHQTLTEASAVAGDVERRLTEGMSRMSRQHLLDSLNHLREVAERLRTR
jgi:DNA-binding MarR family transcriptional regulator